LNDEVDPLEPALIMLLTALPPAPPTPKMVIRGFNSLMSSFFALMLTAYLFIGAMARPPGESPVAVQPPRRNTATQTSSL
jgi:hypothetical protein